MDSLKYFILGALASAILLFGSALTYLRRYSLASICGLYQEDDDGENAKVKVDDSKLLADTAVISLADLESKNITNVFSNAFNAGTKTIYSYGNNWFHIR